MWILCWSFYILVSSLSYICLYKVYLIGMNLLFGYVLLRASDNTTTPDNTIGRPLEPPISYYDVD